MRYRTLRVSLLISLLVLLAFAARYYLAAFFSPEARWQGVLDTTYNLVDQKYVEELSPREITLRTLQGMFNELDPFSQFFNPEEYESFKDDIHGEYGGVGLYIEKDERGIKVMTPIIGGPAFEAGLRPGDVITRINGEDAAGMRLSEARDSMRGEPGTDVAVTVFRPAPRETFDVTLTRRQIHIPSILSARMLDVENIRPVGYIMLADFQEDAAERLEKTVSELLDKGMRCLILDLRGNGGGAYSSAVKVSDLFLRKGVIVRVRYRSGPEAVEEAGGKSIGDFRMAVLVNRGSASASEIVAAALRDNKRAVIVGEPTYGKGSVQQLFEISLPDREVAAAKMTVAYFYSPDGLPISRRRRKSDYGIKPGHVVELTEEQIEQYGKALENEWVLANTGKGEGPFLEEVDPQLKKAVEILTAETFATGAAGKEDEPGTEKAPPPQEAPVTRKAPEAPEPVMEGTGE